MKSCCTAEAAVCFFCKKPSVSIHHWGLLYFIVRLNTSPHGKLGAKTRMEKMTEGNLKRREWKIKLEVKSHIKFPNGRFFTSCPTDFEKKTLENDKFPLTTSQDVFNLRTDICCYCFLIYFISSLCYFTRHRSVQVGIMFEMATNNKENYCPK